MYLLLHVVAEVDYYTALQKSFLYFEAQRSGNLTINQRVQWRGDSGLQDGNDAGIDLVGGYYDAGDNVKFGFPMAFTITMLAWGAVDFRDQFEEMPEIARAIEAIRWGTDYLIKSHPEPKVLYVGVGDGAADHDCWQRPEDMTTPRTSFKIDAQHPGADVAGETAAAFAAVSMALNKTNPEYASQLITHATQLFDFAVNHPGLYTKSIPAAAKFYNSSGFEDELLWAAAWLYRATNDSKYVDYLAKSNNTGGTRTMFSWDDKYVGAQVQVAKMIFDGKIDNSGIWAKYKREAQQFICNCIQKGKDNVKKTPGGLLWWQPWNNLQYVTSASFIATVYSNYLMKKSASIKCSAGIVQPSDLIAFAQSQVNYILGSNPKNMSYIVGVENTSYPKQIHHRGASIVSIKKDATPITCKGGYDWFNKNETDPNVLDGAIVGGPDEFDAYTDLRSNYKQAEPSTITVAPLVGVLVKMVPRSVV